MLRHIAKYATILGLSLLTIGCGPNRQLEHIDISKVPPEEVSKSFSIHVFEGGTTHPPVKQFLSNINATSCKNKVWDPPATKGDALTQLRLKAARLGATAIVEVYFDEQGTDAFGTNCWESITATGTAVTIE